MNMASEIYDGVLQASFTFLLFAAVCALLAGVAEPALTVGDPEASASFGLDSIISVALAYEEHGKSSCLPTFQ